MQDYTVFLRAVASTVTGADLLYTAAGMLSSSKSAAAWHHNQAVLVMTARLLDLPDTDPEIVEYALRSLPTRE